MKLRIYTGTAGLIFLAVLMIADLLTGGMPSREILIYLRLPRVLTAILAGIALSLSGAQMQSIFSNPLADPYIMGISSGAALGAAIATMTGTGAGMTAGITVALAASLGAMVAAAIILVASRQFRSATTLLIFGIMLSFIVNAVIPLLQAGAEAESLKIYFSWTSGSFSNTTWHQIIMMTVAIIMFGDEFASMAGARPEKIRLHALLSSSIMTGAVTAFCGPIGFAGIIAPHIAGYIFSTSSHRIKLPGAMLTGSIICVAADLLSRAGDTPVPIASTMAFVGIPVIMYMLIKRPMI